MSNSEYSKVALRAMYLNGKGILSPLRYNEKKNTWLILGFAFGTFSTAIFWRIFHFGIDGWLLYGMLLLCAVVGCAGSFLADSIFEANFVCDESLQDPLFLNQY